MCLSWNRCLTPSFISMLSISQNNSRRPSRNECIFFSISISCPLYSIARVTAHQASWGGENREIRTDSAYTLGLWPSHGAMPCLPQDRRQPWHFHPYATGLSIGALLFGVPKRKRKTLSASMQDNFNINAKSFALCFFNFKEERHSGDIFSRPSILWLIMVNVCL